MGELLKNRFEETYQSWKGYTNFAEENNKSLIERQKDFKKRVQNIETKEQVEEYFQLQAEPSKHIYDISVLSNNLLELYKLLEGKEEFPKEVISDMEKLSCFKPYYIFRDDKLVKVNESMHQDMENKFNSNIQAILKINEE